MRLIAAGALIVALAEPLLGQAARVAGSGPIVVFIDNGWTAAHGWGGRRIILAVAWTVSVAAILVLILWLTRVAGLNPATSKVIIDWDQCGPQAWSFRTELCDLLREEREARHVRECALAG